MKKVLLLVGYGILFLIFCGCHEEKQFTQLNSTQTGITFRNDIVETEFNNIMTYEYTYNGGGIAVGDLNNNGYPDVYLSGNSVPNQLYINHGNFNFEEVGTISGTLGRAEDWKTGVTMVDINGDGLLDIYVCYSGNAPKEGFNLPVIADHPKRSNQLFINQGSDENGVPIFTENAAEYGLDAIGTFSTQAYFFDYDGDGDLDMFLLNHANMFYSPFKNTERLRNLRHPYFGNQLYRNDGGKFIEVSESAGIHGGGANFGLSASLSDINGDGFPDIYVTNDYEEQDYFYINQGNGTFKEVSHQSFGHMSKFSMGSDIADINNDGLPDIFVADMLPEDNRRQKLLKGQDEYDKYYLAVDSGFHHQYMRNTLQLHRGMDPQGVPRFSEVGQLAGISNTDWSWAALLADFDNDGQKDLFITNGYLRDYTNQDFINYTVNEAVQNANSKGEPVNMLELVQKMPSTKISNYMFRNEGELNFTDLSRDWGLDQKTISNAAVYADLDNDGDLDLIVLNLNEEVFVYRNNQENRETNNFVKIILKGSGENSYGIGSKILITLDNGETILQEAFYTRGYQSSVEPVLTVGIGKTSVKDIKVIWPDRRISTIGMVNINSSIEIRQSESIDTFIKENHYQAYLEELTDVSGINFKHQEDHYLDFNHQRLLPYMLSKLGGKMAIADVNGDGNDDVFFGGAKGQDGKLYFGTNEGFFIEAPLQIWENDALAEDIDMVFFDANNNGFQDLYVVSGGSEYPEGHNLYQDRLYINDGKGNFKLSEWSLPVSVRSSGGAVAVGDFDGDGKLDLFIGGRVNPGNYPMTPKSLLLKNESTADAVKFVDVTDKVLERIGMVTGAVWTDLNGDGFPELIVVGEWMPITIFANEHGSLKNITDESGLAHSTGWWSNIFAGDFDGDGDIDFMLGNVGLNMQFKATPEQPLEYYVQDINQDGVLDPIITYFIQGKSYPMATRNELIQQVPELKRKFNNFEKYSEATMVDILKGDVKTTYTLDAGYLESCWLENMGNGKFRIHKLPMDAQFSKVNGFLFDQFGKDGQKKVLAAGNFYPYKIGLGKSDASTGALMVFDKGKFVSNPTHTPIWLTGDIRDIGIVRFKNGEKRIIVSRNNDRPGVYAFPKE